MTNAELADKVEAFNATVNSGRGTEVLRQAVTYLRREEVEQAQYKCTLDSDKLTPYDGCLSFLADCGLLSESMTRFVRDYEKKYECKK
jgi:hypothetical protein